LDLSDTELAAGDFGKFINVRSLVLSNNRIENVEYIASLTQLKNLEVLDLRYNLISKAEAIANLVQQITQLSALGLLGNRFSRDANYRSKFLSLIPGVYRIRGHPLCVLDSNEITISERALAMPADGANPSSRMGSLRSSATLKSLRWNAALLRRLPATIPFDAILEGDFSRCTLSGIDLSMLPSMEKLSLAHNKITDANLEKSNLSGLTNLRTLDLRDNKLKNLDSVCEVIDHLTCLEVLWVEENLCFSADNGTTRIRFFKKLKRQNGQLKTLNGHNVSTQDLVMLGQSKRSSLHL